MSLKQKYFGNSQFYRHIILVMLPIMIQNAITNFVSMLDNLMVGRLGTAEISAVSVANLLVFVFNLSIFGAVSGAGIFTAQFHGKKDVEGVRHTFRFKLIIAVALATLVIALVLLGGRFIISLYLRGKGDPAVAARILELSYSYLSLILIGMIPHAITQALASTLRETDRGLPPMVAGIVAVFVNLIFNYLLIFGNFGAPKLGVQGAAIATVLSRFVELAIVVVWVMAHKNKVPYMKGALKSLKVPAALSRSIIKKGLPLMINETLWAGGIAFLEQCYSKRGLHVLPACNISNTFFDVFAVVFISAGAAVGIIVGQQLGAGRIQEAKDDSRRLLVFTCLLGTAIGVVYFAAAHFIPHLYNTTGEVKSLATAFMITNSIFFPLEGILNGSYFMVRSGGKTLITMITDSGLLWGLQGTLAFVISEFTALPIIPFYALIQSMMIIKVMVGLYIVKQGKWAHSVVSEGL